MTNSPLLTRSNPAIVLNATIAMFNTSFFYVRAIMIVRRHNTEQGNIIPASKGASERASRGGMENLPLFFPLVSRPAGKEKKKVTFSHRCVQSQ